MEKELINKTKKTVREIKNNHEKNIQMEKRKEMLSILKKLIQQDKILSCSAS